MPTNHIASNTSRWCDEHGTRHFRLHEFRFTNRAASDPAHRDPGFRAWNRRNDRWINSRQQRFRHHLWAHHSSRSPRAVTQVSPPGALAKPGESAPLVVDERLAADLESRIDALVAEGADETQVRKLVGRAIELGRQQ